MSACVLKEPMMQRSSCRYFPFQQQQQIKTKGVLPGEEKGGGCFLALLFRNSSAFAAGLLFGNVELERGHMEPGKRRGFRISQFASLRRK